ncbi:MAG: glycoside hydrolase family 10 protein [Rubricoccaceae bacterium]
MFSRLFLAGLLLAASALISPDAQAQDTFSKQEFRGAWVATVIGLDWPCRLCTSAQQQSELIEIFNGLESVGVNAVVFQVRTEADAFYASPFEPWSYWLTGSQGAPPDPFYDPLELAIELAHERGMELHAWLNPYRADRGSDYFKTSSHVTKEHPEWILSFSQTDIEIMNPGLQEVRDRVAAVVGDIARRYDIDGIHFDDYFYPYPASPFTGITDEDTDTFTNHARGFTDIGDWRRDNVNLMVAQVQDSLAAVRPDAVFGISPFGLWKDGVPTGTGGLDAHDVIFSDPVAWLDAQTIDYITPQLYWSSQRSFDTNGDGRLDRFNQQRFTTLAPWWESVRNDRHLYIGMAAYRQGAAAGYGPSEIPTQLRFTRDMDGALGSILFRANAGVLKANQGLADTLRTDLYRNPALTPTMPWRSQDAPGSATELTATHTSGEGTISLAWTPPASGDADARFYAVYRIPQAEAGDLASAMADNRYLALVTGETTAVDASDESGDFTYVVTAVSANSIESAPSNAATVQNVISTDDPAAGLALRLAPASPNPFRGQTRISFALPEPGTVSLRVVDVLGREVARLLEDAPRAGGPQHVTWTPGATIRSGTYIVVLDTETERQTRSVVYVR